MINYLYLFDGLDMSLLTIFVACIMDYTLGLDAIMYYLKNENELYQKCYKAVYFNLLVLSPIYFWIAKQTLLDLNSNNITIIQWGPIVLIHHLGYYVMHLSMHKIPQIKHWHNFHHQYKDPIFPSVGNAVSKEEFTFAYVLPFLVAAKMLHPNVNNFKVAIGIISLFNLIIHTDSLKYIEYSKYMVSPFQHTEHHRICYKENETYSAPIINIDYFVKGFISY